MLKESVTIGVDESGILSSVGPRPQIGIVCFSVSSIDKIKGLLKGKNSFRQKDPLKKKAIVNSIEESSVLCETIPIEHSLLDSFFKRNLKRYQAECLILEDIVINAVEAVSEQGYFIDRIVIDKIKSTLQPVEYYFDAGVKSAIEKATGTEVLVVEEADTKYPECLAAWVMAYNAFIVDTENVRKDFGLVGSGHPADKKTNEWLKEHYASHRSFASIPHQVEASKIKNFANRCFHLVDIKWRSPENLRDIGRGLSSPYFVLKDIFNDPNGENLEYISLRRNIKLDISIYEKRCPGNWPNFKYKPCKYTDSSGVNGMPIAKWSEMCNECRRDSPPMKCLFNPNCDGYQAACGFDGFGVSFCGNLHANYIVCFKDIVKVGQGLFNSIGQRLLEQGPGQAIIYATSPNRQMARQLEKLTTQWLQQSCEQLKGCGINNFRQTAPKSELLLSEFVTNWDGLGDRQRLQDTFDYLKTSEPIKPSLLEEPIEIDLLEDYKKPSVLTLENQIPVHIKGLVSGFRGHFIYINNGTDHFVLDMDSIKYRIIKGEITYDNDD